MHEHVAASTPKLADEHSAGRAAPAGIHLKRSDFAEGGMPGMPGSDFPALVKGLSDRPLAWHM